jgi:hypothetical protein
MMARRWFYSLDSGPGPLTFAQVKDDLRDMLLSEKIKKAAPDYLAELRRKADIKTPNPRPSASAKP